MGFMAALFIILLATPFSKELGHGYIQTEADAFDGVHGKLATTFFGVLQRRIWNITQHCQFVKREASIIHQFINPIILYENITSFLLIALYFGWEAETFS